MFVRPAMLTVVLALGSLNVAVSPPEGNGVALQLRLFVQKASDDPIHEPDAAHALDREHATAPAVKRGTNTYDLHFMTEPFLDRNKVVSKIISHSLVRVGGIQVS
jgi:hypothetical protein